MGRLPEIKRILREDLKEAPSWIEKLLTPLNSFFSVVYEALNKNITFKENIACNIKEMEFKTRADYTLASPVIDGWQGLEFKSGLSYRATGLLIMQIYEKTDNYIPITNGINIDWIDMDGQIIVNYISGLSNSKNYFVRFLII